MKDIIQKKRTIKANSKTVWAVLTNPVEIRKWLGVDAISNWTVSSDLTFRFTWDGKQFEDKGVIICFDSENKFSYTYWSGFSGLPDLPENYSKIEFQIDENNGEVTLLLIHSNFATETMLKHSDKNWEHSLDEIRRISEERTANR